MRSLLVTTNVFSMTVKGVDVSTRREDGRITMQGVGEKRRAVVLSATAELVRVEK